MLVSLLKTSMRRKDAQCTLGMRNSSESPVFSDFKSDLSRVVRSRPLDKWNEDAGYEGVLVTFCQHLLRALLFIEDYFRSLAHTTLYINEARNPIFCIPTRFWCAVGEDVNKKFQVPQSLEEKQRMMYYLTNFHLQCWFLSPANCLQTHFSVPQNQYEKQRYRM